jgi:sugar/nucleoside kinase (ribokinase family)
MKTYDVAVVGEIYVDHIFTGFARWPQPGEEVFSSQYVQELGGGGAITACALGRLARSVSVVGVIGAREMPWISERFSLFGVDNTCLRRGAEGSGVTASVSDATDRTFFTYVGANAELEEQLAGGALFEHLARARHVHFATTLGAALAAQVLDVLRAAGCTTSLDVGHQPRWLVDAANHATCARVDYLLPNEREARILSGGDAEEYLRFTARSGWPNGVIKLGVHGAAMRDGNRTVCVPAPAVQTVDTTGAGDAFNAGFIDGLLDGQAGEESLRRGCVCGGLSTRAMGGLRGLPARIDLERCYEEIYG